MTMLPVPQLLTRCDAAVLAAEGFVIAAKNSVTRMIAPDGKIARTALDQYQRTAHALAWYATYTEALRQMARWAHRLEQEKRFGEIERFILLGAFAEYLAQMAGGILMSQNEIARPGDL